MYRGLAIKASIAQELLLQVPVEQGKIRLLPSLVKNLSRAPSGRLQGEAPRLPLPNGQPLPQQAAQLSQPLDLCRTL